MPKRDPSAVLPAAASKLTKPKKTPLSYEEISRALDQLVDHYQIDRSDPELKQVLCAP
jgi:hypothetical protein